MLRRLLTTPVHRILGYRRQDRVPNARVLVGVGMATDTRQYHRSHLKMTDTANEEGKKVEDPGLTEYYGKRKALYQAMANKAGNSDAIIDWYDKEADIYEAQFEKAGFEYPSAFVETTLILAKNKQSKILDVAAGSGKVGMKLRKLGYTNLDGLDGSSAMLALAKEKDIYNNYICCTVGSEKLRDIPDASYDFVFCAGGVSRNHLSLETIPTMLRAVKPNGYLYFNHSSWSAQFPDYSFEKLDRIIKILEQKGLCSSADIKKEWNVRPGEPTTLYILQRGKGAF